MGTKGKELYLCSTRSSAHTVHQAKQNVTYTIHSFDDVQSMKNTIDEQINIAEKQEIN